jgi:hypothetical protein
VKISFIPFSFRFKRVLRQDIYLQTRKKKTRKPESQKAGCPAFRLSASWWLRQKPRSHEATKDTKKEYNFLEQQADTELITTSYEHRAKSVKPIQKVRRPEIRLSDLLALWLSGYLDYLF